MPKQTQQNSYLHDVFLHVTAESDASIDNATTVGTGQSEGDGRKGERGRNRTRGVQLTEREREEENRKYRSTKGIGETRVHGEYKV